MEFSTIYFNEASELDYQPMQVVISRLAQKNSLTKRIFFDFNPPNKTHWSYWLFIKKLNPVDDEPLDNPEDYGYLLINPKDNLDNIDEEYLKILERMPQKDRERFLEGKFSDTSDGAAYYSFNRERHVKEVKRMNGTIWVGVDFNVDPCTSVIGHFDGKRFYIFDEVFLRNSDTYKLCDELIKRGYGGARLIPDSTGKNRKTSGKSDFDILKENGFRIESTRNPFVTDRVNNLNRLFQSDKVVIDYKCKKLIADLEKVMWKDNKLDQKTDKLLTHVSDCLSYMTWKLDPISYNSGVSASFS